MVSLIKLNAKLRTIFYKGHQKPSAVNVHPATHLRLTCDSLATHLRLTLRLTLESGKPDDCYTAVKKPKKPQTIFCFTDPPLLK